MLINVCLMLFLPVSFAICVISIVGFAPEDPFALRNITSPNLSSTLGQLQTLPAAT